MKYLILADTADQYNFYTQKILLLGQGETCVHVISTAHLEGISQTEDIKILDIRKLSQVLSRRELLHSVMFT